MQEVEKISKSIITTNTKRKNVSFETKMQEVEKRAESSNTSSTSFETERQGVEKRAVVTNFFIDSNVFIEKISNCLHNNSKCHVFYQHIGKTAGTTIQDNMFRVFPFLPNQAKHDSCCNLRMVERFQRNKELFCKADFTSYEVTGSAFRNIVSECMELNPEEEAVILISFRSPEHRTLSYIHQYCNKNLERRPPKMIKACKNCNKKMYEKLFYRFAHTTNKDYKEISDTLVSSIPGVKDILMVESIDVDNLINMLGKVHENWKFPKAKKKQNTALFSHCDFSLNSRMFDLLAPSRIIYRNLVLNNF